MTSVYEKYGLKPVINASGRMTILGVSTPSSEVIDTVKYGLDHYFEMKDLVDKTGAYIASLLKVENALRSEEHTSNSSHYLASRMPSSA